MKDQEVIYKRLWEYNRNEILARKILQDSAVSPSLRAIAYYLLRDNRGFKDVCKRYDNESPKDIFWLEVQLILDYIQHLEQNTPIDELKSDAEALSSMGDNLIFSRLLLAGILARQGEYQRSISTYESVLSISPTNLSAFIGLMGVFIVVKQPDRARHMLRRALRVVLEIPDIKKRIYWWISFFIYGLRVCIERSILIGLMMFVMPFFPQPLSWIMLVASLGVFLLLMLFARHGKESWAISILKRLFLSASINWLIGYGTKALFIFVEGL